MKPFLALLALVSMVDEKRLEPEERSFAPEPEPLKQLTRDGRRILRAERMEWLRRSALGRLLGLDATR